MKEIRLSGSILKSILVSDEDYAYLINFRWTLAKRRDKNYAKAYINGKNVFVHNLIMKNSPLGLTPDHIDGDGLNNQRDNLRLASRSEQQANTRVYNTNTSGYRGVSLNKRTGKYVAYVGHGSQRNSIGYFFTPKEAVLAYNKAATKFFGQFAKLNIVNNATG